MQYRVRRCFGPCHSKEVRGDGSDLSRPHFIIKMLMDHSRKSLQSFNLLLLNVLLDVLGSSVAHLCLVSVSGELELGYVQCLFSAAGFSRLQFPLSLNIKLLDFPLFQQEILVMMAVVAGGLPPGSLRK